MPEEQNCREQKLCMNPFEMSVGLLSHKNSSDDPFDHHPNELVPTGIINNLNQMDQPNITQNKRWAEKHMVFEDGCMNRKSTPLEDMLVAIGGAQPRFISFVICGQRWKFKDGPPSDRDESSLLQKQGRTLMEWRKDLVQADHPFTLSGCQFHIPLVDIASTLLKVRNY